MTDDEQAQVIRLHEEFMASWSDRMEAAWARVVPARFTAARVDDVEADLRATLVKWLAATGGDGLVLFGPPGTGKTHAAAAVARERFLRGDTVQFWNVSDLFDALRPEGALASTTLVTDADLLVLDDLGGQKLSEWTVEQLDMVVNARWMEVRPTIVTSNFPPEQLPARVGERVWSRLVDGATAFRLSGADRRRAT